MLLLKVKFGFCGWVGAAAAFLVFDLNWLLDNFHNFMDPIRNWTHKRYITWVSFSLHKFIIAWANIQ